MMRFELQLLAGRVAGLSPNGETMEGRDESGEGAAPLTRGHGRLATARGAATTAKLDGAFA